MIFMITQKVRYLVKIKLPVIKQTLNILPFTKDKNNNKNNMFGIDS